MCDAYEKAFGDVIEDLDYTIRYYYNNESCMSDLESNVVADVESRVIEEKNRQEEERLKNEIQEEPEVFAVVREPQYEAPKKDESTGFQKIKSIFGKK